MLNSLRQYFVHSFYCPPNVYYLRNWQVTFLLYTLGVKITEYIAKASMEPRDYRVVFLIQKDKLLRFAIAFLYNRKFRFLLEQ